MIHPPLHAGYISRENTMHVKSRGLSMWWFSKKAVQKKSDEMEVIDNTVNLSIEDFIKFRLTDQIDWYDQKSGFMKKRYQRYKIVTFAGTALTTFSAGMGVNKFFTLLFAAVIAFSESVLSLQKYQELWINYRTITELLKKERIMYQTKTGIYQESENPDADLIERSEAIISSENINWTNLVSNDKKKGN